MKKKGVTKENLIPVLPPPFPNSLMHPTDKVKGSQTMHPTASARTWITEIVQPSNAGIPCPHITGEETEAQ